MTLGFSYAYGLLTAAIPRTGGDYTLISRIIHPAAGVVAGICQAVAAFLSVAFFGIAFVTTGLSPGLVSWGLIDDHPRLVSWGTTLATSHGWQIGIGSAMIIAAALIYVGGWHYTVRIQFWLFVTTITGVLIALITGLVTSHQHFIDDFNSFAQPYTHSGDSYGGVIAKAQDGGIVTNAPFSFSNTIPIVAVLAGFVIYTYFSTYIGGELRRGGTVGTAHRMAAAGIIQTIGLLICVLIVFNTYGKSFLTAAYAGGMPDEVPAPPYYFFLTGVILNSGIVAFIIALTYCAFWPLQTSVALLSPNRMFFAFSFDGILPKSVASVTKRHTPLVAVALSSAFSIAALVWAVQASDFFQVLVYATLIQLVAMTLVGITAMIFPWRRPELYRASVSNRTILGIPVVSIAGAAATVSGILLYIIFIHYTSLGFSNTGKFVTFAVGTVGVALLFYIGAFLYRRSQGTDLNLVYVEIPPE
jgi:APA family basic amino acid/polyamine antiporter